jgi:F0F1-type ATP synthase assembly protein I
MSAAANAGMVLVATILVCALVGAGIGALFDASFPLAVLGVFVGFGAGLRIVYTRFRDL